LLLATILALLAGWGFLQMGEPEVDDRSSAHSQVSGVVVDGTSVKQPNWARVVDSKEVLDIDEAPNINAQQEPLRTNIQQDKLDQNQSEQLWLRIELLEERLAVLEQQIEITQQTSGQLEQNFSQPPLQEREVRAKLQQAGFESQEIEAIEKMQNEAQLQRLELRDRAARVGEQNTEEFRQAMRAAAAANPIRERLGDNRYDEYLHARESNNRVMIDEVIPGSAAQLAGIRTGDVIFSYAQQRVFRMRDLQALTSSGSRGETVEMVLYRNDRQIQMFLPRGPLGVTISGTVAEPR